MAAIIIDMLNYQAVDYAHTRAIKEQERNNLTFADIGMRAARARDQKLLKVLEKAAEIMVQEDERQRGQTRRNSDIESERRYTTETQMWREAYRMVVENKAKDVPHLMWIYAAAAFLAGYQV